MAESFALTTPIYYVNDKPHLGTAYTTIACDTLSRFQRMDGKDVFFLTGLDEHGQKVADSAAAKGVTPQQWCDDMAPRFKDAWASLNIQYDYFVRTTDESHTRGVEKFLQILLDNGYLYKDSYEGWYCVPEETFFTETQVRHAEEERAAAGEEPPAEGVHLCPDCNRPLQRLQEESWFFKLSAFEEQLLKLYEERPDFVQPEIRRNEVVSFVKGGLKDLSISRTTFDWGVPLPFDEGHVTYVWVDALLNYITAMGFGDEDAQDEFNRRWPAQYHFIGKDIIRFHCVIWPAMLMAAGMPLPEHVFAHGFLLTKGEKMSKSKGNAVSPADLIEIFGVDAYRYYFMTDVPFGNDGSISMERMVQVYNADLANTWGNLCSRAFNMAVKYFDGEVPVLAPERYAELEAELGNPLREIAEGLYAAYAEAFNRVDFTGAAAGVAKLSQRANAYIEEMAPWNLAKDEAKADELRFVIYNTLEAIRLLALYYSPWMPTTSEIATESLGLSGVTDVTDLEAASAWGKLDASAHVSKCAPLFPRLQVEDLSLE